MQAWSEIRQSTRVATDANLQNALNSVTGRLLVASNEAPSDWEVLVFRGQEPNAFALPGRKIGVYEGMFRVIANLDQLAAIIGHEIGHLQSDHSQERMNAQAAKGFGVRALPWILETGEVEYSAEIEAALGIGLDYGLILPYSRRQELEADRLGLITMASAGYQLQEAVTFWQRMEAAATSRPPAFLTTHPAPQSRIEAIRELLPEPR